MKTTHHTDNLAAARGCLNAVILSVAFFWAPLAIWLAR
jgi:hypothetical protein